MNRLFCSLEVYIHRQTHVPKVYWPITRSIWGSICFIPAYLTLIHFTAVWWLGIIKLITVGYSDCVSQCINSVAHLVSAASRCMGEVCQWILITCILLRIFQDINVTESQNHILLFYHVQFAVTEAQLVFCISLQLLLNYFSVVFYD